MVNEPDTNERLSAFVDGELRGRARDRVVDALYASPELRRRWTRFHLIGDAVRGIDPVPGADVISERVGPTLSGEQIVHFRPRPRHRMVRPLFGLALAATIATVAILGVHRLDGGAVQSRSVAGVSSTEPATAGSVATVPERIASRVASAAVRPAGSQTTRLQWNDLAPDAEARLNVYLVNHNEYAGIGMRGVLPYVRIVGYQSFAGD